MLARTVGNTSLAMGGLALTGAWVDTRQGAGGADRAGSSDLCAHLTPGEPVILMGPTGAATHVCGSETVLLAGGGLGNAVLFSIGGAFRSAGSKVLYFAGYKNAHDRLAPFIKREHTGIGSISSPMQCMLKEVCAQCLQKHKDPVTGEEKVVFTRFDQDQPLDKVDFASLAEHLDRPQLEVGGVAALGV